MSDSMEGLWIDPINEDGTVKLAKDYPLTVPEIRQRQLLASAVPLGNLSNEQRRGAFFDLRVAHTYCKMKTTIDTIQARARDVLTKTQQEDPLNGFANDILLIIKDFTP